VATTRHIRILMAGFFNTIGQGRSFNPVLTHVADFVSFGRKVADIFTLAFARVPEPLPPGFAIKNADRYQLVCDVQRHISNLIL
jgi:hypothetical protein